MDFIITWVDGNDPEWRKEYTSYKEKETGDKTAARFRDWENLQYWFRGIEKFAPWVDKIHFVTWGHVPAWLNTNHPKLHIVNHKDYIPEKYLPTFNSHTIELNFHRIKELSDEYVYFNDDMFLINHLRKEDFFKNGKPCDMGVFKLIIGRRFNFILMNNIAVLRKQFKNKRKQVWTSPSRWFNLKYGLKNNLNNLKLLIAEPYIFTGFAFFHLPQASLKSTLQTIWEKEHEELDETCSHTFRTFFDVSPYLQRFWDLASNNFTPYNIQKLGRVFELYTHSTTQAAGFITQQKKPMVCINDHEKLHDFEGAKKIINQAFESILPEKSTFEK